MEITNSMLNLFSPQGFSSIMQMLAMFIQVVYVLFSFMLTRQVKIMNRSFSTSMATPFSFFANLHFLVAVALVIMSLIIL
ncbi:hypothetical protein C4561_03720 [candidate division WWE3 bacterium]|jgi:flagellar biosynthesis protein FlhB|uniref:Uncharacterized protein n=1 Tax=candidate division WWE3 bacterium TaxID=2053526 RepID=A0A3A4ZJX8_UNCKA|nr:MAG: hypothetical protein C4561_03720 [candidate division WWE3 bacterium]